MRCFQFLTLFNVVMVRKILKYSDPTKALAETDLDRIQKKVPEEVTEDSKYSEVNEQTAAQLSFNLPASSYATMALRELMKISTSVRHPLHILQSFIVSAKILTVINWSLSSLK